MKSVTIVRASAAIGALMFGWSASGALAAPAAVEGAATKVADASQIRAVSEAEEDDSANCSKSRKRLWIEGEGWIVRKVTICR